MLCFVQLRKALLGLNCLVNLEQCTTVMLYTLNNSPPCHIRSGNEPLFLSITAHYLYTSLTLHFCMYSNFLSHLGAKIWSFML